MRMEATRLHAVPVIGPDSHPSIGTNIQGPSAIRVPPWLPDPLGRFYLYFADHKGRFIRLAFADDPAGPWTVHPPGALHLRESLFPSEPPAIPPARLPFLGSDELAELTTPHIASPDVHVDHANRRILMFFHGLEDAGTQRTRLAVSPDGLRFTTRPALLGPSYMRIFRHAGAVFALAMPGTLFRSPDGLSGFEPGPTLFNPRMRHAALLKRGDELLVVWTQVEDAPERILLSRVPLRGDWRGWTDGPPAEVLRPELPWEGADAPLLPSVRGTAPRRVNQLRDPAILADGDELFLFYAGGGESGIGVARLRLAPG